MTADSSPAGIGWRIRRLRLDRGWRQTDLAAECGVNALAVGAWERGQVTPSTISFCRLADAFECTTDYLIRGRS